MPLIPNAYTPDSIMLGIIAECRRLKVDDLATVCAISCAKVESGCVMYANEGDPETLNFPYQKLSKDKNSAGIYQQRFPWWDDLTTDDGGGSSDRMSVPISTKLFITSLLKQKPSYKDNPGEAIANTQNCREDLRWKYGARMEEAWADFNRLKDVKPSDGGVTVPVDTNKPDFNEFAIWSPNNQGRNGVKIDCVFLHTQEGGGGNSAAEDLANYLANPANKVSYHYTGSQASDGGTTIVDCVDTDRASWSVLSANNRSINYCFAGSRASDSRATWMKRAKVIDAFAYLIVQDCKKYGIPIKVIKSTYDGDDVTYKDRIPGISDHQYVTEVLGDGSHTDVGPNFPWDYFDDRVKFWAGEKPADPTNPTVPTPDYVKETWDQLRVLWPQLGGRTLVNALGAIGEKLGVEGMYDIKNRDKK